MPVTMQQLQNLSQVTDLDQLKFGADNQLEKRVGLGAFFRKVGDAFLKLSASGRASIAARNEKLMAAFSEAVKNAREAAVRSGHPPQLGRWPSASTTCRSGSRTPPL